MYLGGGTPTFTGLPRSSACSPRSRVRRADGRGEPGDLDRRSRLTASPVRGRPRLARRTVVPAASARDARPGGPAGRRRRAFGLLRDAGFTNISLDLIYGIPGQSADDLARDLEEALALAPGAHLRLRARGEARDTVHARPRRRARAAGGAHGVVLRARGRDADRRRLPLVRDGQLLPSGADDLRCRHNLGYWLDTTTSGSASAP